MHNPINLPNAPGGETAVIEEFAGISVKTEDMLKTGGSVQLAKETCETIITAYTTILQVSANTVADFQSSKKIRVFSDYLKQESIDFDDATSRMKENVRKLATCLEKLANKCKDELGCFSKGDRRQDGEFQNLTQKTFDFLALDEIEAMKLVANNQIDQTEFKSILKGESLEELNKKVEDFFTLSEKSDNKTSKMLTKVEVSVKTAIDNLKKVIEGAQEQISDATTIIGDLNSDIDKANVILNYIIKNSKSRAQELADMHADIVNEERKKLIEEEEKKAKARRSWWNWCKKAVSSVCIWVGNIVKMVSPVHGKIICAVGERMNTQESADKMPNDGSEIIKEDCNKKEIDVNNDELISNTAKTLLKSTLPIKKNVYFKHRMTECNDAKTTAFDLLCVLLREMNDPKELEATMKNKWNDLKETMVGIYCAEEKLQKMKATIKLVTDETNNNVERALQGLEAAKISFDVFSDVLNITSKKLMILGDMLDKVEKLTQNECGFARTFTNSKEKLGKILDDFSTWYEENNKLFTSPKVKRGLINNKYAEYEKDIEEMLDAVTLIQTEVITRCREASMFQLSCDEIQNICQELHFSTGPGGFFSNMRDLLNKIGGLMFDKSTANITTRAFVENQIKIGKMHISDWMVC